MNDFFDSMNGIDVPIYTHVPDWPAEMSAISPAESMSYDVPEMTVDGATDAGLYNASGYPADGGYAQLLCGAAAIDESRRRYDSEVASRPVKIRTPEEVEFDEAHPRTFN